MGDMCDSNYFFSEYVGQLTTTSITSNNIPFSALVCLANVQTSRSLYYCNSLGILKANIMHEMIQNT